jgi:hypothetical protein
MNIKIKASFITSAIILFIILLLCIPNIGLVVFFILSCILIFAIIASSIYIIYLTVLGFLEWTK